VHYIAASWPATTGLLLPDVSTLDQAAFAALPYLRVGLRFLVFSVSVVLGSLAICFVRLCIAPSTQCRPP